MSSLILRSTARVLLPLLLLFSIYLLLRGHNEPGGGFIGGLLASIAVILQLIARGAREIQSLLPVDPRRLVGLGLLVALGATIAPVLVGETYFTALWGELPLPGGEPLKLGLPLLFDLGVYLVVFGVTLGVVLTIAREEHAE
jgi:multicomponent Na+:H+ antiporter subunit B